jgi:hypothetical protein
VWGAKLPHSAQVPGVRVDEGAVEGAVQRDVSVERIAREARDEPRWDLLAFSSFRSYHAPLSPI